MASLAALVRIVQASATASVTLTPASTRMRAIQQMLHPAPEPAPSGLAPHRDAVVTRPTPFAMPDGGLGIMGEADPEAILPVVSGAGGQGVRATGPDGSETVLPLRRAADGKLGVAVPEAAAAPADRISAQAAAVTRMLCPGTPAASGADAILPLASGPRGRGVRAIGPGGAAGVLPVGRGARGALSVQLPDVGAILRRPSFFADGGVIGRLSAPARVTEAAAGAGGGIRSAGVVIHNNNPAARVEARERESSDGIAFDVVIEQLESALADRARRGVGSLSGVLGDSFGLGRVGR